MPSFAHRFYLLQVELDDLLARTSLDFQQPFRNASIHRLRDRAPSQQACARAASGPNGGRLLRESLLERTEREGEPGRAEQDEQHVRREHLLGGRGGARSARRRPGQRREAGRGRRGGRGCVVGEFLQVCPRKCWSVEVSVCERRSPCIG